MYHKIARIWIFEIWKKIELRFQLCAERIFIHGKIPFIYIYSHNTQKKKQKCSSVERSTHLFWIKCKMNSPTINPYIVDPMKIQPKSTEKKNKKRKRTTTNVPKGRIRLDLILFFPLSHSHTKHSTLFSNKSALQHTQFDGE